MLPTTAEQILDFLDTDTPAALRSDALRAIVEGHLPDLLAGRVIVTSEIIPDWERTVAEAEGEEDPGEVRFALEPFDPARLLARVTEDLNPFTMRGLLLAAAIHLNAVGNR